MLLWDQGPLLFFGASLREEYVSSSTGPSDCVRFHFKRPGFTVTGVACKGSGVSHCVCVGDGLLLHVPLSLVTTQGSARSEGYDVISACNSTGSAGNDVIPGCFGFRSPFFPATGFLRRPFWIFSSASSRRVCLSLQVVMAMIERWDHTLPMMHNWMVLRCPFNPLCAVGALRVYVRATYLRASSRFFDWPGMLQPLFGLHNTCVLLWYLLWLFQC